MLRWAGQADEGSSSRCTAYQLWVSGKFLNFSEPQFFCLQIAANDTALQSLLYNSPIQKL